MSQKLDSVAILPSKFGSDSKLRHSQSDSGDKLELDLSLASNSQDRIRDDP